MSIASAGFVRTASPGSRAIETEDRGIGPSIVANDHAIVRQGLISALAGEADVAVLGEAADITWRHTWRHSQSRVPLWIWFRIWAVSPLAVQVPEPVPRAQGGLLRRKYVRRARVLGQLDTLVPRGHAVLAISLA